ncbi:hypothetical protein FHS21_002631 [Phyllobacterium trifolii]|jgi:hypothetical protein|uniref:Uncharacterized protein n=1 Tax=Phyllobacterium trifolii TaxID=300193 RepID=A0A839U547_9HYPH|nr:hypothetical protein [Phyllobacterium trifolii]MBB3146216.1 hypothetical protein [Phyllobacterium trifolii]
MTIEPHIEELHADLRNAVDRDERRQIVVELAAAVAAFDALRENMLPALKPDFRRGCDPTAGSTGAGIVGRPQYPFSVR